MKTVPEVILHQGLLARGVDCHTVGHSSIEEKLRSGGWDVIHLHHGSYGIFSVLRDDSAAKLVYTSHDGQTLCGMKMRMGWKALQRLNFTFADSVVALSPTEAEFQAGSYNCGDRTTVIPNGLPPDLFGGNVSNVRSTRTRWRILFVGQLIPLKGIAELLQAVHLLKNRHSIELRIVYHNSEFEATLKSMASKLCIAEQVSFLGSMDPAGLRDEYCNADVFVLPSRAESLPTVITEAMMCGTPILATCVGGIKWQTGDSATLIGACDSGLIAEALERIFKTYQVVRTRAEAGMEPARARFSSDQMTESHLSLYRKLILQGVAPRRQRISQIFRLLGKTSN